MADLLSDQDLHAAMADRPHWEARDNALERSVQAPSFLAGVDLVGKVARAAEEREHHPDIDIRWTTVTFRLSTHSAGGITSRDVELAGVIDALVDELAT
jgi:4a-hydroxytetrahydrobiopterin dehydratase